ncbi:hypothetical protein NKR74_08090 [Bacillus sp. 3103sda1]|uniref:hypothetical protein n=1 Tax=Bacillus sp. 3103sda1 TaxID=2953808 RepID=UPI0020A1F35D|nr:hypothetical protein [Bacillus sp. 3103sda1]MCP1123294.1 hypothetical protein [Bacillus sp. 3103sda1]
MFQLNEEIQNLLKQTLKSQNRRLLWAENCKDLSIFTIEQIHELQDILADELIEKGFDEEDNINNLGKELEELINILGDFLP